MAAGKTVGMKIIETLKRKNRPLLEMHTGILFLGIICRIVGAFIVQNQAFYAKSLWFGILLSMASAVHMYRSLDRALDYDEKNATKLIFRAYMIRYVLIVVIMLIIMVTEVLNPLVVFMAYMSLKVAAYIQPITHKLFNRLFHETDPIPQAMPEEEPQGNVPLGEDVLEEEKE